jgi:hypothetical protein
VFYSGLPHVDAPWFHPVHRQGYSDMNARSDTWTLHILMEVEKPRSPTSLLREENTGVDDHRRSFGGLNAAFSRACAGSKL